MKDKNSARDPIKELRKCSPEEKRELAIELARTRDLRIIDELIRMSEGRRNGLFSRYSEASQLIGLEALGETGSSYAIQYLIGLCERREFDVPKVYFSNTEDEPIDYLETRVFHPHARGKLGKILSCIISGKPNAGNSVEHIERAKRFEDMINLSLEKLK